VIGTETYIIRYVGLSVLLLFGALYDVLSGIIFCILSCMYYICIFCYNMILRPNVTMLDQRVDELPTLPSSPTVLVANITCIK
jgi:hypothetical protein